MKYRFERPSAFFFRRGYRFNLATLFRLTTYCAILLAAYAYAGWFAVLVMCPFVTWLTDCLRRKCKSPLWSSLFVCWVAFLVGITFVALCLDPYVYFMGSRDYHIPIGGRILLAIVVGSGIGIVFYPLAFVSYGVNKWIFSPQAFRKTVCAVSNLKLGPGGLKW